MGFESICSSLLLDSDLWGRDASGGPPPLLPHGLHFLLDDRHVGQVALVHQQRTVVHHGLVVIEEFHLQGVGPGTSHGPAVEEAGGRGQVAGLGAARVPEDGDVGRGALQVDLEELTEAVDGGGVCHQLQEVVARVVVQLLEGSKRQLQL